MNTRSPLRGALRTTAFMIAVGVAYRYVGAAIDPGLQTWGIVAAAPLVGLTTYLQVSGKNSLLAALFFCLGIGALVFWTLGVTSGRMPIASRSDAFYATLVFAFPVVAIGLAVWTWRKRRIESPTA